MPKDYDFAGYVTKNDIRCSDGVIIKHDAFRDQDGKTVPLVWQHNHDNASNVLGNVRLRNVDNGVYGFGSFNDSPEAISAKEAISHGDINAMSIFANRIKRTGANVVHGNILEVSLVMAGANPGALIDEVVEHSDTGDETAVIYPDTLIHMADDVLDDSIEHDDGGSDVETAPKDTNAQTSSDDKTIGDIVATMNEEQKNAMTALIGLALQDAQGDNAASDDTVELEQNDKGGNEMKTNLFDNQNGGDKETISHADFGEILGDAMKLGSLKDSYVEHGITNIETLFPEAKQLNPTPVIYKDQNTASEKIIAAITKSPFSRIKTRYADFTTEQARALGYIKGNEKKEQIFSVSHRETAPQTIYKKQKLDRDDIIDIEDFDVVTFIQSEMRMMLNQEIARAVLVGDGRSASSDDKIKEENIRPIISDDDLYTIKAGKAANVRAIIATIIKTMSQYQGSGSPSLYMNPVLIADMKLLTAADGRYLFGDIPTEQSIAARLGVKELVPTTFLAKNAYLIVNLSDYQLGASKGGQVTTFDDFDIDFNKYTYLIETRVSGALVALKSAIYGTVAVDAEGNPITDDPAVNIKDITPGKA